MAFKDECGRRRGGARTGIVIHSAIPSVGACRLCSHCHLSYYVFYHPTPTKTAPVGGCLYTPHTHTQRVKTQNLSLLLKMQMRSICGLLLSEWVSLLRDVVVCSCECTCGIDLCVHIVSARRLYISLTQSVFALTVCICVLGNCVL